MIDTVDCRYYRYCRYLHGPDDHVLHPAHYPPVPVLLDDGGVAGVEPAVRGDNLLRLRSEG